MCRQDFGPCARQVDVFPASCLIVDLRVVDICGGKVGLE